MQKMANLAVLVFVVFFNYYFPEWVPPLVTPLKGEGGKKKLEKEEG